MRFLAATCVATLLSAAIPHGGYAHPPASKIQPAATTVALDSGPIRGVVRDDLVAYLGIPYAAPPVGPLRWMPPRPVAHWTSLRDADRFGSSCAQNAELGVFGKAGGQEDCLYLNVFVPKHAAAAGARLPVLFWIHGGSLWVGASDDYDASKLTAAGNAIVVTINYRLGMFGFFAHPALDREHHVLANYGMMDQQFALDWVQRNIASFGGDPGNVTIFGESSGGNSVMAQIAAPSSAGKFQHAIAMSGSTIALKFPAFGSPKPLDFAERTGVAFARAEGCGADDIACLRGLSTRQILKVQRPYLINQVIIDGTFMPAPPADLLAQGRFNKVTFINGNTLEEGTFFVGFPENESGKAMTASDYPKVLRDFYGEKLAAQVLEEYPLVDYQSPSEAFAAANTASQFACPARLVDRWMARSTPTFAYEFSDRTAQSYLRPTTFPLGAAHTYELPSIFPGFHGGAGIPVRQNALQEKLSDAMVALWAGAGAASKASSGWSRYDPAKENVLMLSLPAPHVEQGRFGRYHHCDFWDKTGQY